MTSPVLPYQKSSTDGVWQRPDIEAFAYSDGDEVENRITSILASASDLSVLSGELRTHITDWPSNYHLSSQRANLMRPLSQNLTGSVLEIGSGCGAITRYLGETATSVLALEGSRRRAHISRTRTRDLGNVDVYCDEFSAFETSRQFDAVTLIGVLEYAHMFIADEQAALRMLEKTTSLLNENGSLIIAIENQLGLKYFAGAPEDHLGTPVLGIEDQYTAKGVRTYGKQALTLLLQQAGFQSIDFLHPFPDYKMPSCVLAERAFDNASFNAKPFLVATAGKDPQLPPEPSFSLERTWPVVDANGVTSDLSNSFLIVARKRAGNSGKTSDIAWHFSTQRKPEFCKETVFSQDQTTGEVLISRTLLGSKAATSDHSVGFRHHHIDTTPYSTNELLSSRLIDAITRSNWTYQDIAGVIGVYANHLARLSNTAFVSGNKIDWDAAIPGEFFDCIPQNICIDKDDTATSFDLEWHAVNPLSFKHLAFRSLWTAVGEISLIGKHAENHQVSLYKLAKETFNLLGYDLSESVAQGLVQQELAFQSEISGKPIDHQAVWDWISKGTLRHVNAHALLLEHKSHSLNMVAHLAHVEASQELQINQEKGAQARLLEELQHERRTHEEALAGLHKRHGDALKSAHIELGKSQGEVTHAKQESRDTYKAVRRLAQASASQFIGRKSPKNFLKQWIEYRQVMHRSTVAPNPGTGNVAMSLLTATRAYLSGRPALHAYTKVSSVAQAQAFLNRSTHWAFPFQWTFIHDEGHLAQSAGLIAQDLDIDANFEQCSLETQAVSGIRSPSIANDTLILVPKTVSTLPEKAIFEGVLPEAETVRLAYVAMITDKSISAIYMEAPKAPHETGPQTAAKSLFCLIRPAHFGNLLQDFEMLKQHIDMSEFEHELFLARKHVNESGHSLLVI